MESLRYLTLSGGCPLWRWLLTCCWSCVSSHESRCGKRRWWLPSLGLSVKPLWTLPYYIMWPLRSPEAKSESGLKCVGRVLKDCVVGGWQLVSWNTTTVQWWSFTVKEDMDDLYALSAGVQLSFYDEPCVCGVAVWSLLCSNPSTPHCTAQHTVLFSLYLGVFFLGI